MVIDQGTILDRIDFNMESAVDNATSGLKNIGQAEGHQKEAGKCIIT
jgi:SNARE domain